MATEENNVYIKAWPAERAKLEHYFDSENPAAVSVQFVKDPAHVVLHTLPERPMNVDMDMNVFAKETIPVCIKLCDPICAASEYTIAIDIFDRPVATITIRGKTKFFNTQEEL